MDPGRPLAQLEDLVEAGLEGFLVTGQAGALLHRLLKLLLQQVGILFAGADKRQQQKLLLVSDLALVDRAEPNVALVCGRRGAGAASEDEQIRQRVSAQTTRAG